MNLDISVRSLATQTGLELRTLWLNIWTRKRLAFSGLLLLMIPALTMLRATSTFADHQSPKITWDEKQETYANSLSHARLMLHLLQEKLNLAPEQVAAWNTWSAGMIEDYQRHREPTKSEYDEPMKISGPHSKITTPAHITHDINRLRAQVASMGDQLSKLEASEIRTTAFYDTLDANQRNTFDAFWNEAFDIHSGQDISEKLRRHSYHRPIT